MIKKILEEILGKLWMDTKHRKAKMPEDASDSRAYTKALDQAQTSIYKAVVGVPEMEDLDTAEYWQALDAETRENVSLEEIETNLVRPHNAHNAQLRERYEKLFNQKEE